MRAVPLVAFLAGLPLVCAPSSRAAEEVSAAQQSAICGARATCAVAAVTPAGTDEAGTALAVAEVKLGLADRGEDAPEEGCFSQSDEEDAARDGGTEYWLLRGPDAPRLLLALCNDGYGAAGVGWDEVEIADNRLTHTQEGGSNDRWSGTSTYSLSPYRRLAERDCSFHNLIPWSGTLLDIDYERFQARSVKWQPGDADAMEEEDTLGCPDWPDDMPFTPKPNDEVYGAWVVPAPLGMATEPPPDVAGLGDCALTLRSDGSAGFLVHGKPADEAGAAEVRVIAMGYNRLLVQVYDPAAAKAAAAAAGKSWIHAPHLEVWTSEDKESEDGVPGKLYRQVGVGLDGAVNVGAGEPMLPTAKSMAGKDEQGRDVTLLDIAWADEYALLDGLGVVYSQSEGGKQARLVANAGIVKNKPLFLPNIWTHIAPSEEGAAEVAHCAVTDGTLQVVR